ncbi:hypothetical protein D0Z07_5184 [Hyphodiscus hymeniophilus]|uniref:Uncharacterized protein n=1 Tax=Hyphodiscus hymeniophilus TaxID=353542 RepID=A0A9P6VI79_9HELO|nr:hypothetical protein D0Z07_5184 [Hyphodiscus hymeniophilus]
MPERTSRQAAASSTSSRTTAGVRRNLFHQHLSRRPTTSSTSTSAETLRLDNEHESETSDIVIRNKDGEFEIGDMQTQDLDEQEEGGEDVREDEKLLEAVKMSLRAKVAGLAEDNWMYEAEEEKIVR